MSSPPEPIEPDPPYMSLEEAARYVRMKPETLRRKATDGQLSYVPTRPAVFIRTELDRMMIKMTKRAKK